MTTTAAEAATVVVVKPINKKLTDPFFLNTSLVILFVIICNMIVNEIIGGIIALVIGIILHYYSGSLGKPIDIILKIVGIILVIIGVILIIAGFLGYGIISV